MVQVLLGGGRVVDVSVGVQPDEGRANTLGEGDVIERGLLIVDSSAAATGDAGEHIEAPVLFVYLQDRPRMGVHHS